MADLETFRGRYPLGARGDRRVQPHRLVDDSVEQIHRHEILIRKTREGIELFLQPRNEGGVMGEMEEDVGQGCSHTVAARDDDELGVAVQVPPVTLRLGALLVCRQDPREDVGLVRLVHRPLVDLLLDPVPEGEIVPVQQGCPLEEGEQPGEVGEEGNVPHVSPDGLEDVGLLSVGHHVGRFVECQVLHDIEDEEVKPFGHVKGCSFVPTNNSKQLVDGLGDPRIVSLERCIYTSVSGWDGL